MNKFPKLTSHHLENFAFKFQKKYNKHTIKTKHPFGDF